MLPPTSSILRQLEEILFLSPVRRHFFGLTFEDNFVVRSSHASWQMTYNLTSGLWTREPCLEGGKPLLFMDQSFYCFDGSVLSCSNNLRSWVQVGELDGFGLRDDAHLLEFKKLVTVVGTQISSPHICIILFWSPATRKWSNPVEVESFQSVGGMVDGCNVITF